MAGSKPHVIWIRRGNCSTAQIEQLLRANVARIGDLEPQPDAGFLVLL
jgi:predicted nuclease of predicted toxin-antitoxin system